MSAKPKKAKPVVAATKYKEAAAQFEPVMTSFGSSDSDYPSTRSRRNVAGITERSYKFKNIEDGLTPFKYDRNYSGESSCSVYEAVILCQKAYYNYGPLRNIIELMVDFSSTDIYLKGSTAKIRKFYISWFNKVNLVKLISQFFREYYRSGNVFIYPFLGTLKESDLRDLVKYYGNTSTASARLPVEYTILNPADIQTTGTLSLNNSRIFYKRISDYELETLRNPRNSQDQQVYDSLPEDIKKQIKTNQAAVLIPLPVKDIVAIFYAKMQYEPFSIPMPYPVLEDINYKLELKRIDMALSRSVQQCLLLVTLGSEPEKGGINPNNILAMQKLLENQTVGRSIVSDYTTKAEFITPKISDLLNSEKYTIVDKDIDMALNNILAGDDKFANQKNKIDVFIARLEQGRKVFLNEFLIPQMIKVAEEMGFGGQIPVPHFDNIVLSDDINTQKNFTRLIELGILTPESGVEAINTGRLPNADELLEAQKAYKQSRDEGFYEPLVGGSNRNEDGRPAGTTGIPKSSNKVGQIGSGEIKFDMQKIAANMVIANKLDPIIRKKLKAKFKLKELTDDQESLVPELKNLVLANCEPSEWVAKVGDFCDKPIDVNKQRVSEVSDLAIQHQLGGYLAGILFASKKD